MSKNIREYLPKRELNVQLVQGRVPKKLRDQVEALMEIEGITWTDLLTALLTKFVDEMKAGKKSA